LNERKKYTKFQYFAGTLVTSLTKTFMPYYGIKNCKDRGNHCQGEGILHEVFNILQNMLNFTLRVDEAETWGSIPKVREHNI